MDAWMVRRAVGSPASFASGHLLRGSTEELQGRRTAFLKIKKQKKEKLLSNISLLPILLPGNTSENQSDLCIRIVIFYSAWATLKFLLRGLSLASFNPGSLAS